MAEAPAALSPWAGGVPVGWGSPASGSTSLLVPPFSFLRRCWRVWEEHHRQTDEVSGPHTIAVADAMQTLAAGSETSSSWGKLPTGVAAEHVWGAAPQGAPQRA